MLYGKLVQFKEWLTIKDACKFLSENLDEQPKLIAHTVLSGAYWYKVNESYFGKLNLNFYQVVNSF